MEKMMFDEFAKAVVEKIREYLPESFANASVELQTVLKNNGLELTGLTIRNTGSNICPTIYLEQFFEAYSAGEDIKKVMENIASLRLRNEVETLFDANQITDFEQVKERIIPRVINREWNRNLLSGIPYTPLADLAVIYHILIGDQDDREASTQVTNQLIQSWGIDVDDLHKLAIRNMLKHYPSTFRSLSSVLEFMLLGNADESNPLIDPTDEVMFILTNGKGMYGAAALLDKKTMDAIADRFEENFYILPASLHEVLIILNTSDIAVETLEEMVKAVNTSDVQPHERLGEHVYRYSRKNGLQIAR